MLQQNLDTKDEKSTAHLPYLTNEDVLEAYVNNFGKYLERAIALKAVIKTTMMKIVYRIQKARDDMQYAMSVDEPATLEKLFNQLGEADYESELAKFTNSSDLNSVCSELVNRIFNHFIDDLGHAGCGRIWDFTWDGFTTEHVTELKNAILNQMAAKMDVEKQVMYMLLHYLVQRPDITIHGIGRALSKQPAFVKKDSEISRFHFLIINLPREGESFIIDCGSLRGTFLSAENSQSTHTHEVWARSDTFRKDILKSALLNNHPNSERYRELNNYIDKFIEQPLPKMIGDDSKQAVHLKGVGVSCPLSFSASYDIKICQDNAFENKGYGFTTKAGELMVLQAQRQTSKSANANTAVDICSNNQKNSIFFNKNDTELLSQAMLDSTVPSTKEKEESKPLYKI